ncbi:slit homolog 1 protein-like isoform X3 [Saccostrea cucullata]|uniref:slit homolog 1 protein-like isoform X3 n=1 Tax=Saccostrea cuccullata TaxID=36930 RepID=UPI002ED1D8AC
MIATFVLCVLFYKSVTGVCPEACNCTKYFNSIGLFKGILVDCSSKALTEIPANFPKDTYELDLSHSRITSLQTNAFIGLSRLWVLDLSSNRLASILVNAFNGLSGLSTLYLSHNRITSIHENTFNGLSRLSLLAIYSNPFHCDCGLRSFVRFLQSKRVALYRDHPECASPSQLKGTLLTNLSVSSLRCPPSDIVTTHNKTDAEMRTSSLTLSVWEITPPTTFSPNNAVVFTTSEKNHYIYVQKLCQQNSSLVLPHPRECQLYYDCSTKYNTLPPNFVQHMRECPFPDLFSLQTLRCEDYRHVTCAERTEYKTACKYRANQLNVYHVMCVVHDVETQETISPGILGNSLDSLQGSKDMKDNAFINPNSLVNSRLSLDALKKDLCSN